jgi:hypothetical protein
MVFRRLMKEMLDGKEVAVKNDLMRGAKQAMPATAAEAWRTTISHTSNLKRAILAFNADADLRWLPKSIYFNTAPRGRAGGGGGFPPRGGTADGRHSARRFSALQLKDPQLLSRGA